ncbi:pentapeptide repeat-containing protein [Actinomadura sp. J1-007]|nr:pentapeptide repeat-containing protein [Actinomadura sp. J1-007]
MPPRAHATRARLKDPTPPKLPASLASAVPDGEHDLVDDGVYLSLAYGPADLVGRTAEDTEFERCSFTGTRLSAITLQRAALNDVAFNECDLANARFSNSRLFTTAFDGSRLTGAAFTDCGIQDVLFDSCRADLAGFRFSVFRRTIFRDCNLEGATFQKADLRNVRFERCRLSGAQFSGADMAGARFTGCDLRGIGGVQSLRGVIVAAGDAPGLLSSLTAEMGITIEDA